jgi:acetate---CoA ligase (ADP-forming)
MTRWPPERLAELFAPRSVALVGASERSKWGTIVHSALTRGGYPGRVELVNGRGGEVFGRTAVARLVDLDEPVDVAYVMVPCERVLPALEDAVAAGIRNAVVLSAGFAEAGDAGRQAQESLVRLAVESDLAIIGPNTLGYLNVDRAVTLHPHSLPGLPRKGHVSLVAQSGALNGGMLNYCDSHAIGLSKVISVGNEAVVDVSDVIGYLAEDDDTMAIAVFLEAIRRPAEFVAALDRARANSKPVVILKVGRNEVTARVAAAHTGAFVGDDRVIDAVLRQHAAIRVDSLDALLTTASVLARGGPLRGRRLAVAGISGGACDIIADRAVDEGLELAPFSPTTVAAVQAELPAFGTVNNPLDVTGAAVSDQQLFGRIVSVLGDDPGVDMLLIQHEVPTRQSGAVEVFRGILDSAATLDVPAFVIGVLNRDIPADDDRFDKGAECIQSGGLDQVVRALGRAAWWSEQLAAPAADEAGAHTPAPNGARTGVWSEARSRELLGGAGVPLVPAILVRTVDEAVTSAKELGWPVVVKANADDLPHKTDVGAIALDVSGDDQVRRALSDIAANLAALGRQADGYLVSPMRPPGTELIVGVARDETWGLILAVGIGGVLTEVQADTALRLLPVGAADVRQMLSELRNRAVLDGVRGRAPADLDATVSAILSVARTAGALDDDLLALEVNPLLIDGDRVEALDALVSWKQPS